MFSQIIYTRCGYGRVLFADGPRASQIGQSVSGAGFKVHTYSEPLRQEKRVTGLPLLEQIVGYFKRPTGQSQDVPFCGYCYFRTLDGVEMLGKFEEIEDARPGNFVSQFYVGEMDDYPVAALDSEDWTAWDDTPGCIKNGKKITEQAPPDFLPQVERLHRGPLTRKQAAAFINDGRMDAFLKALWAVIKQLSATTDTEKYILIEDTPQNVGLWAAAIQYALPLQLARRVSFTTNLTEAMEKNRYTTDAKGDFVRMMDLRDPTLVNRPRFLVCGVLTSDPTYNQTKARAANAPCYLIEGAAKKANFAPDASFNHAAYAQLVKNAYAGDLAPLKTFLSFLRDYDATAMFDLLGSQQFAELKANQWNYASAMQHLPLLANKMVKPYGPAPRLLATALDAYPLLADQDQQRHLALAKLIEQLCAKLGRPQDRAKLDALLGDELLRAAQGGRADIKQMLNDVSALQPDFARAVQGRVYAAEAVRQWSGSMDRHNAGDVVALISGLAGYLATVHQPLHSAMNNDAYGDLLGAAFDNLSRRNATRDIQAGLAELSDNAVDQLAVAQVVAQHMENHARWWQQISNILFAGDGPQLMEALDGIMASNLSTDTKRALCTELSGRLPALSQSRKERELANQIYACCRKLDAPVSRNLELNILQGKIENCGNSMDLKNMLIAASEHPIKVGDAFRRSDWHQRVIKHLIPLCTSVEDYIEWSVAFDFPPDPNDTSFQRVVEELAMTAVEYGREHPNKLKPLMAMIQILSFSPDDAGQPAKKPMGARPQQSRGNGKDMDLNDPIVRTFGVKYVALFRDYADESLYVGFKKFYNKRFFDVVMDGAKAACGLKAVDRLDVLLEEINEEQSKKGGGRLIGWLFGGGDKSRGKH